MKRRQGKGRQTTEQNAEMEKNPKRKEEEENSVKVMTPTGVPRQQANVGRRCSERLTAERQTVSSHDSHTLTPLEAKL